MLEQFILRKFIVSAFNWVKKNISQIVNFIFGSFTKMPVRVSLAILGSSALTISFIAGLLFGFLSVTFFDDTFKHTLQNGFYAVLLIVLIWAPTQDRRGTSCTPRTRRNRGGETSRILISYLPALKRENFGANSHGNLFRTGCADVDADWASYRIDCIFFDSGVQR
jgi:hypothetical protein